MTTWWVRACGLNSLKNYFNVKTHGIWEGSVITRRNIWIEHIRSIKFGFIREEVTIQRVTLRRLRSAYYSMAPKPKPVSHVAMSHSPWPRSRPSWHRSRCKKSRFVDIRERVWQYRVTIQRVTLRRLRVPTIQWLLDQTEPVSYVAISYSLWPAGVPSWHRSRCKKSGARVELFMHPHRKQADKVQTSSKRTTEEEREKSALNFHRTLHHPITFAFPSQMLIFATQSLFLSLTCTAGNSSRSSTELVPGTVC